MKKEEIVMGLYNMRLRGKSRVTQERNNTVDRAVELIDQLDEPEQTDTNVGLSKPVIPQFVADYIEQSKKDNDSINQVFAFIDDKENKELWDWLFPSIYDEKRINQERFMRAWLDGYEVEKEKRYQVKIPITVWDDDASELKEHTLFLAYDITSGETRILSATRRRGDFRTDLTEAQIKAIDKRYWDFV